MSIDVQEAMYVLNIQLFLTFGMIIILRKAIRDMHPIIDPEEDYLTIVTAEQTFAASEAKRKKELEEAHAKLKGSCISYKKRASF